jgi:preprotein translocase subunit YajC
MSLWSDVKLSLAQQAAPAAPPSAFPQFIFLGLMLAAMYFLMIAPQRKKQKEQEKMLAALGTGDDVITNSGIYGTITNVKEDRFVLRIADNTKIEIAKAFIQAVVKKGE